MVNPEDAQRTHTVEQAAAALGDVARVMSDYYAALVKQEIPRELAYRLCVSAQDRLLSGATHQGDGGGVG